MKSTISRGATICAVIVALIGSSGTATAQHLPPTAEDIVFRIRAHAGIALPPTSVDRFKAGDSTTRVTGIAITMMATLDVLQRAATRGNNFIITHEPTFYSHRDTLGILESENDAVLSEKQRFIREHHLVIWRFHDTPHAMTPDMINEGIIHALGWETRLEPSSRVAFNLPPTSLRALAAVVGEKLGANAIRISGNPDARISTVVLTQGFPGFPTNRHAIQSAHPDAVIIGEDHEWETIEYVVDAITEGKIKGLIVLGHIPSEQAGMIEFTKWIGTFVTEVPIHFIPTPDPFRPLR